MAIDTTKKVTNIKVDGVSMTLAGGGTSKLPSVIDGSIEVLNEEDFGDATNIRIGAFDGCINLKEVHIPETVKIVHGDASAIRRAAKQGLSRSAYGYRWSYVYI